MICIRKILVIAEVVAVVAEVFLHGLKRHIHCSADPSRKDRSEDGRQHLDLMLTLVFLIRFYKVFIEKIKRECSFLKQLFTDAFI